MFDGILHHVIDNHFCGKDLMDDSGYAAEKESASLERLLWVLL